MGALDAAVTNSGVIEANGGALTLNKAVTGGAPDLFRHRRWRDPDFGNSGAIGSAMDKPTLTFGAGASFIVWPLTIGTSIKSFILRARTCRNCLSRVRKCRV